MSYLYTDLANQFARSINQGLYKGGDRIPAVRSTSLTTGVSPATVVAAYRHLELEGYIESRPRSGFYVRTRLANTLAEPQLSNVTPKPKPVTGQEHVLRLIQQISRPNLVQFGANVAAPCFLPTLEISKALAKVSQRQRKWSATYEVPPGLLQLRHTIARRMAELGNICSPDDVIITNGCQEALYLSLKSKTQVGDIVAVESPTYYGLLQIIDALGLKALEIPTDPKLGISVSALELALEQWPIRACIVSANFSNPLGALMPEKNRQGLVDLINSYPNLTLIEDDIYGDLNFEQRRPSILQSLDTKKNIIYCSSFSKTLAPGLRIGWIVTKRDHQRLEYEKFVTNCATPTVNQMAVAELVSSGKYNRHLKGMRIALQQAMSKLTDRVHQHLPASTKVTRPIGGMALWLEFDKRVSAIELSEQALSHGISIAPGPIFSSSGKYKNCIRMTCAIEWNTKVERALEQLGQLVRS